MKLGDVFTSRTFLFLKSLSRDDSGQATIEYILILSASVLGAAAISRAIINALDRGILFFGAQLEKDLRTGRVPVDVWKN